MVAELEEIEIDVTKNNSVGTESELHGSDPNADFNFRTDDLDDDPADNSYDLRAELNEVKNRALIPDVSGIAIEQSKPKAKRGRKPKTTSEIEEFNVEPPRLEFDESEIPDKAYQEDELKVEKSKNRPKRKKQTALEIETVRPIARVAVGLLSTLCVIGGKYINKHCPPEHLHFNEDDSKAIEDSLINVINYYSPAVADASPAIHLAFVLGTVLVGKAMICMSYSGPDYDSESE